MLPLMAQTPAYLARCLSNTDKRKLASDTLQRGRRSVQGMQPEWTHVDNIIACSMSAASLSAASDAALLMRGPADDAPDAGL